MIAKMIQRAREMADALRDERGGADRFEAAQLLLNLADRVESDDNNLRTWRETAEAVGKRRDKLKERVKDLEALHEAHAEMDRCCFGPEVSNQDGYEKAERRFDQLHDRLWPSAPTGSEARND